MRSFYRWSERQNPGVVLLPWLVPAILGVCLKIKWLGCDAFRESAFGVRHSGTLTGWEKASLFRSDLGIGLVLVPLALVVGGSILPRIWRAMVSTGLALASLVVMSMEEIVRCATGNFASARMLAIAANWALRSHDNSLIYISTVDRVELAASVALILFCALAAAVTEGRRLRRINVTAVTAVGLGAIGALMLSVTRAPEMVWSEAVLVATSRAALDPPAPAATDMQRSIPELQRLYGELAHAPAAAPSEWSGRARDYNVLFFVMETAPAQAFDPARDDLRDMPNVRRLRQHAFVASDHFTTLALTSSAVFSLFTSWYPHGPSPAGNSIGGRAIELPGAIRSLRAAGYRTGFYGYVWKAASIRDDRMLSSLGFEKIVEPTIDAEADRNGATTFKGPLEYVQRNDSEVLAALLHDIRRWTSAHQKFAAAFFPEMGHDPWRALKGSKPCSVMACGHALAVYQDAWLGMLLEELKRDGALGNTIVVVTGDHGLRTVASSDRASIQLAGARSDDALIHVPLLVSVPHVLPAPVRIDWPTSHIDVAPTVLDLLGVQNKRGWEQGADIWNPALRQRRLFLAMDVFGAAMGFSEAGTYFKRNRTQAVFKNSSLNFGESNVLLHHGEESKLVRDVLDKQGRLQQALLFHLFHGDVQNQPISADAPGSESQRH